MSILQILWHMSTGPDLLAYGSGTRFVWWHIMSIGSSVVWHMCCRCRSLYFLWVNASTGSELEHRSVSGVSARVWIWCHNMSLYLVSQVCIWCLSMDLYLSNRWCNSNRWSQRCYHNTKDDSLQVCMVMSHSCLCAYKVLKSMHGHTVCTSLNTLPEYKLCEGCNYLLCIMICTSFVTLMQTGFAN